MSYSYSYKSSSGSGGAPTGSSSSYRFSNTSSGGMPASSNPMMDAEFQAAKMQAGMPMAGSGGSNSSYSYKSSSSGTSGGGGHSDLAKMKAEMLGGAPMNRGSSSYSYQSTSTGGSNLAPNFIPDSSTGATTVKKVATTTTTKDQAPTSMEREFQQMGFDGQPNVDAEFEAAKLRAGMVGGPADTGSSYSSYSSTSSGGALHPVSGHGSTGGSSVKKVTTTTTSRVNPATQIQADLIERDLNRMGRLPDNYDDDFEKLKNQVLSGEAYKGEVTAQPQTHQRVREELMRTKQSMDARATSPNFQPIPVRTGSIDSGITEETTTTTTKTYNSGMPGGEEVREVRTTSTNSATDPSMYKSELYIPIKRHDDTFDNFHMHRWREHSGSLMDHELDTRRQDWEGRLNDIRSDFFKFSPSLDAGAHGTIDKSRTISQRRPSFRQLSISNSKPTRLPRRSKSLRSTRSYYVDCTRGTSPAGRPEFSIQFEVKDFKPEEINLSTKMGKLYITASHEEKIGNSTSRREFKRTVDLPADVQVSLMRSVLSKDGILSITAPINAPAYQQPASSSSHITQQHATALNTTTSNQPSGSLVQRSADSHDALNYNMSVVGYKPNEVHVTVEGRKVKVHAKHEESAGGRKVHNEMTKMFDLPPTVNPNHVRSFIKDGHTLYIEAQLRDDVGGKIHVLPVNRKY